MALPPLLLHVGYHKTATTWFQNVVFQAKHGFPQVLNHSEIFETIISPHGLRFKPDQAHNIFLQRRGAAGVGSVDVISLESLSGNPFFGGRESDDYADRLKRIIPDAKILLTIREQVRIIASVYMQYLQRGGTESAERFFSEIPAGGYFRFDPGHFEYHRLVGRYQELFGAENVLVLPLETVAANQVSALKLLVKFTGNTQLSDWNTKDARGVSYPERAAPILRRINHLRQGPMNPNPIINFGSVSDIAYRLAGGGLRLASHKPAHPVSSLAQKLFGQHYSDSNRKLAKMLAHVVDLSAYQGISA